MSSEPFLISMCDKEWRGDDKLMSPSGMEPVIDISNLAGLYLAFCSLQMMLLCC